MSLLTLLLQYNIKYKFQSNGKWRIKTKIEFFTDFFFLLLQVECHLLFEKNHSTVNYALNELDGNVFYIFLLFRQKQNKFNVAPCFPGKCIGQLNVDLTRRNLFIFKWRKRFCCRFQCHTYVLINKIAQWSWSFWKIFCIRHIKEMLIDSYFKIFVSFNLIFQIVSDFLDLIKSYYVKDVFSIHLIKQKKNLFVIFYCK